MSLPSNPWNIFQVTADTTGLLANDNILGALGRGWYKVIAYAAAAADGSLTINDGKSNVVDARPIPVRAAAVTYPELPKKSDDVGFIVRYIGEGPTMPINLADGTNAEIIVVVLFGGRGELPQFQF